MLKIELEALRVVGAFFRVADEMRRLPAYFNKPETHTCFIDQSE